MPTLQTCAKFRFVVSLDRKCRSAEMPGRSGSADRRTFSTRRLEGRRWWLRRARRSESCEQFGSGEFEVSGESRFGVDHPVLAAQTSHQFGELFGFAEHGRGSGVTELLASTK